MLAPRPNCTTTRVSGTRSQRRLGHMCRISSLGACSDSLWVSFSFLVGDQYSEIGDRNPRVGGRRCQSEYAMRCGDAIRVAVWTADRESDLSSITSSPFHGAAHRPHAISRSAARRATAAKARGSSPARALQGLRRRQVNVFERSLDLTIGIVRRSRPCWSTGFWAMPQRGSGRARVASCSG
jgi:hypothetical protein